MRWKRGDEQSKEERNGKGKGQWREKGEKKGTKASQKIFLAPPLLLIHTRIMEYSLTQVNKTNGKKRMFVT